MKLGFSLYRNRNILEVFGAWWGAGEGKLPKVNLYQFGRGGAAEEKLIRRKS
jgi:hypothetical protein